MRAWSFACRTADEVAALLRALEKHRYIRSVDHQLHWLVDAALAEHPAFAPHAQAFARLRDTKADLDVASRDPRLWRPATVTDVNTALGVFWAPGPEAARACERLATLFASLSLPPPTHEPFAGDEEFPHHPELLYLSWTLHPVAALDPERHAGALRVLAEAGESRDESSDPAVAVDQEGPDLGVQELTGGAPRGVLRGGAFVLWADGPFAYNDYVFQGASRAAKLLDAPQPAWNDESISP